MQSEETRTEVTISGGERIVLRGPLCTRTTQDVWQRLSTKSVRDAPVVDCSAVTVEDSAAIALLSALADRGFRFEGLGEATVRAMASASSAARIPPAGGHAEDAGFFESVGRSVAGGAGRFRANMEFLGRVTAGVAGALRHPFSGRLRAFPGLFERTGADAVPVTMLIGFLLGLILAFESAIPLQMFGAEVYVGNLIGIAVVRELAVLVAAIVMAGRTASAFAAELGTMVVGEEVDALRTMGVDPIAHLAVPRVVAAGVALPLLSLFAGIAALAGGYVVLALYGYSFPVYVAHARSFCAPHDVLGALAKALVFGLLIGGVGCARGLRTGGGSDAVGQSTTGAVVSSIVVFAVADGLFAILYKVLGV